MRGLFGAVVRFLVSALVLLAVGFFLPGFEIMGFRNALLAAVVIAVIGYVIEGFLGEGVSPQSRGLIGFITSALVLWITQFIVPEMRVSIIGAMLAAFAIGLVDAVVPTELR